MTQKNYTIVKNVIDFDKLLKHLNSYDYFAFDTETTGLNVRKDKVIGASFCGKVGESYYVPTFYWNGSELLEFPDGLSRLKKCLDILKNKEIITFNGSFDIRVVKNNFGVDLRNNIIADAMLLKHTVEEEGIFALKKIAIAIQDKIGLNVEEEANKEQIELKENVAKNGGSTTKENFEMYKADLDIIGIYACFAEKSSLVTMSDGSCKYIEDVKVGDTVIDHTGTISEVYDTLKQNYKGDLFDIELEVGRMQKNVTPYHRFLVLNQQTLKEEWLSVKDIREGDLLVRPYIGDFSHMMSFCPEFWWLYGMFLAEGHVRKQGNYLYPVFSIHQKESCLLKSVLNKLGYQCSIHNKKDSQGCDITVCASDLGKLFIELSGGDFKCYEKKVSQEVLFHLLANKRNCISMLSGLFDGDGHYRKNKKTHQLTLELTSPSLINLVDILLSHYGINSTRGSYKATGNRKDRHYIKIFGNDISFFNDSLLIKSIDDSLSNKSPTRFKKYVRIKRISSSKYDGLVYNIEVKDNHSYISNGIISHNCADADLTLRVADYYNSVLENASFFYDDEVMPLYREVTIGMEDRGVKLDLPIIEQAYVDITKKIEEYKASVIGDLLNNPDFNTWLEDYCNTSFPVKPSGKFAQEFCAHLKLPLPFDGKKYSITKKTIKELSGVGLNFFSGGDCPPHIAKEIQLKLWKEKNDGEVININSKKQLGEFVFDYAKIKPLSTTAKGAPQFDDDFIEHLGTLDFPWAKTLSDYNKLIKIKSTYIERFLFNHEDGFFYFSYKQHGTISGRYGSDAQQLPRVKEDGELSPDVLYFNNLIRSFFIAEEGRVFIDCDYESLEPHVFSHVSNDDGLRDIFRKGHDFYSTIAIKTEKMENVSADKKADNYLGKVAKPKRQSAKAYSLGVPYGMTDFALGKTLGISTQEAAVLIDGYLSGFPELKEWMEVSRATVKATGKISSQAGRIRHLPKAKELFEKHGDRLLDFEYRRKLQWKLANKHGKDEAKKMVENAYRDYKNSLNNSLNFQIQSLSASIVNRAAIAVNREFKKRGIDAWVCAQIHDQLIFNVPYDRKEECSEIIKSCMENTTKLSVDLKAPPCYSVNWRDGH